MKKIGACVLLLALAAGACGGDDEPSPSGPSTVGFPEATCTASREWQSALGSSLNEFQEAATEGSTPQAIKTGVSAAFENFRSATEKLTAQISELEIPADEGAGAFKDRYVSILDSIKGSLDELIEDVEGISTASQSRFKVDLQSIAAEFKKSLSGLGNPFTDMPAALRQKFDDEASCEGLLGPEAG